MASSPNYQFTAEDQSNPTFCLGCYTQIPKAVADSCSGLCPICFAKGELQVAGPREPLNPATVPTQQEMAIQKPEPQDISFDEALAHISPFLLTGIVVICLAVYVGTFWKPRSDTSTAIVANTDHNPRKEPFATLPVDENNTSKPATKSAVIKPPVHDMFENLASQVKLVSADLDQQRGPNYVDTVNGTFLHIHWANKSKRPIREVWAIITVLDGSGNPVGEYDHLKWCLYYEAEPIPPGGSGSDDEQINNWPETSNSEGRPTNATVTITTATEGQVAP